MKTLKKLHAIKIIIHDARSNRISATSYGRLHRALISLELDTLEITEIEQILDYRKEDGTLYSYLDAKSKSKSKSNISTGEDGGDGL